MANADDSNQLLIHIIVVGFHHKKGCQVEYSYPPLVDGESNESSIVPEEWKYLPFLALPDGAHNYTEDTVYFHLPPRSHYTSQTTVYGVSCYRQISAHLLKRKHEDVTRETVQKCVIALSQSPIYGILHAKLQMITQAYFEEKDFAKNHILKELFEHVNMSITRVDDSERFLGLSARTLVLKFQHKVLILFKLILLERRVLFYTSPVHKLVGNIMALLSLYPDMIEKGLSQCTTTFKQHSEYVKKFCSNDENINESNLDEEKVVEDGVAVSNASIGDDVMNGMSIDRTAKDDGVPSAVSNTDEVPSCSEVDDSVFVSETCAVPEDKANNYYRDGILLSTLSESSSVKQNVSSRNTSSSIWDVTSGTALSVAASVTSKLENLSSSIASGFYSPETIDVSHSELVSEITDIEDDEDEITLTSSFVNSRLELKGDSPARNASCENTPVCDLTIERIPENPYTNILKMDNYKSQLDTNEYGLPLSIFTRGYLCLPYVSLQQINDLNENLERGYVFGGTNILFKTQTHLADVVVDIENANIEIRDNNLKRLLHLTAADLRFAEDLVNNVTEYDDENIFQNATGWEGGNEWIQARFTDYIISLLSISTVVNANPKDVHDFNEYFLAAWKQTQNYQIWLANDHSAIDECKPTHPFHAQYSVNDVRLRLHHSLQSSDRGRKIEGAVSSANQTVLNTGKLMGAALVSAKSSVSSWWSNKLKKET